MVDIFDIEKKYKKDLESLEEWNYLRNIYRSIDTQNKNTYKINKPDAVKSIFYGFKNWFRRYDYLVFSDSSERKLVDNKMFDIKVDYIIKELGIDNTLVIENPICKHYKLSDIYTKKIVSKRFIDIFTLIIEKIYYKKFNIEILNKINLEQNIDIDYQSKINRFNAQYKIYKIWLSIQKPKKIYLDCFYDKQFIIKAAKELKIEIIDVQHGLIGTTHSAYFSDLELSDLFLPEKLFSFGVSEKENLLVNGVINSNNIIPVGNFYLDYIYHIFSKDNEFSTLLSSYDMSFGVSLQWTVENELIDFITEVALKLPNIIFILIARNYEKNKYDKFNLPKNVIFYNDLDCYNIILHCDYHCTVYSTCAIEAPSLGIENVLININGYSEKHISALLSCENSYLVNTEEDFFKIVKKKKNQKDIIIKSNVSNFMINYKERIKEVI
jgi:hypothetical protein